MAADTAPAVRSVVAVTPVFNRRELTLACLGSLFDGDLGHIALHVIVVDDGSSDGTAEAIAAAYPQVQVIRGDGTLWYSEGTNVGIREAQKREPDYILIFNNDSLFPPQTLARLVATAETHPTSLVGAALIRWDDKRTIFQVGTRWQTAFGGWRTIGPQTVDDLPDGPFPVETFAGNCVLIPAAALLEAGLMKSGAMPNFGDSELVTRMRRKGWRLLLDPKAPVLCEPNQLPRRLSSMSVGELYQALWGTRTSYHNLKQRHATNIGGAPSRWQGYAATGIFIARLSLKFFGLAGRWPNDWPERPLKEVHKPLLAVPAALQGDGRMIVYAWPYTPWGGVQVYMLQLMKAAKAHGYRVAAIAPQHLAPIQQDMIRAEAEDLWLLEAAADVEAAPTLGRKWQRRLRNAAAARDMIRVVRTRAPADAILHVDAGPWDSSTLLSALLERHHVVMSVHTGLRRLTGRHFRAWRRGFDHVVDHPRFHLVAVNGEARRSLSPYVAPERLDRVPVSQPSFDPERISEARQKAGQLKAVLIARLGLGASACRIVVGAQFIARKGCGDLLAALRRLRADGVAVNCLWLAPSAPADGADDILDEPDHRGLIDLRMQSDLGTSHGDYLAAVAALADMFVLPSHLEGLPLALIEAMAMGVPCIATSINAIPEAIRNGRNGLLVPPHDPMALAHAIERLAGDPGLRAQLGANARSDAHQRYSLPIAAIPTLAVYQRARDELHDLSVPAKAKEPV